MKFVARLLFAVSVVITEHVCFGFSTAFTRELPRRQTYQNRPVSSFNLQAGTPERPLYDGTNYTFPDTTTPAGIAELLEVSFVQACMQLRSGYVDILKLFIAAATAGFELGFPIDAIQQQLSVCPRQTAGRPLLEEEVEIRHVWYCLVYLTLATIGHPTRVTAVSESIPDDIKESYGFLVDRVAETRNAGEKITVEKLMNLDNPNINPIEKALRAQAMRVMTLTLVVQREAAEARTEYQPLPPPIPGAFE